MALDEQIGLGNAGSPFTILWKGTTYKLSFLIQRVKSEIVRWAKQEAVRQLNELRPAIGEEKYQEDLNKHIAFCKSGKFSYDSQECQDLRETDEGKAAVVRVLLGEQGAKLSDGELFELIAEKGEEITTFIAMGQANVQEQLKKLGFLTPEELELKVKREMGWDEKNDPEGKLLDAKEFERRIAGGTPDPKVQIRCLKAAGMWE